MKFADVLTSVMNGVRVRRKSWPEGYELQVEATQHGGPAPYVFTTYDAEADDWQIVVPKPRRSGVEGAQCG